MKRILIIDCGSSKIPLIEEIIFEYADYETMPFFEVTQEIADSFDGIIISGAPLLITEEDMEPYLAQASWIKTTNKPVLGICFGHQLIGLCYEAFGARMKDCRSMNEIEQFVDCPLLYRLPDVFDMQEDHCESISIPQEFELVANSDECVNEVMQHETRKIYGVQFHPESSGNYGHIVLENFVELC